MIKRVLAKGYLFGDWLRWSRNIIQTGVYNLHTHILGASGVGKSRFLYSQIIQDILDSLKFRGKHCTIILDPHGDLLRAVLNFIGKLSGQYPITDNLIIIEPANQRYGSPGINVLESIPGTHPYETIAEIVSACKAIWRRDWGPRLEDILRNSASLLQEHNLTFGQLPRLLSDNDFRRALVERSTNRDLKIYWQQHFDGLRDSEQRYFVESTRNKVAAFLACPYTRPVLSQQRSTINFFEAMNSGKIILINLSQSRMKTENRRLFGALVLSKIFQAVIAREAIPENQRVPVSLYCDEVHEVFNRDAVLPVLEGGRKYNIQMTMAHQSLSQLEPEDVDVILANSGTLVAFSLGRLDAERLSKEMWAFNGQEIKFQQGGLLSGKKGNPIFFTPQEKMENCIKELMIQKTGECYIRLRGQGEVPYIANIPKIEYEEINQELEEKMREISASHYNRPLADISRDSEMMEAMAAGPDGQGRDEPTTYRE